jgi:peptidyl-tRNA hydrolase, PTH1 family
MSPANVVVVHDELNLPFGTMRCKLGDNGRAQCAPRSRPATSPRVRVGIGRPPGRQDPANFLLSNYSAAERKELPVQVATAADAVETLIFEGLDRAQRKFTF